MKYYLAPMEGITGYIYRNLYQEFFHNVDKYFTPFVSPNQNHCLQKKELKDIAPEHNEGMVVVPQILTNRADYFTETEKMMKELGYKEVNLNLGCPSGTVAAKGKGSGFLAKKEELDLFLEEIFSHAVTKISVKTRLGRHKHEEFYELIEIFNKYPIEELIIHPRVQKEYYKNKPNLEVFADALRTSKNPVCYNGNIFTAKDYQEFTEKFPQVECIMCGRGVIGNPGLIDEIKEGVFLEKHTLKAFHDKLYNSYQQVLSGDKTVLFKMKEIWYYMIHIFSNHEIYEKKIRKAAKCSEYDRIIAKLFREEEIIKGKGFYFI